MTDSEADAKKVSAADAVFILKIQRVENSDQLQLVHSSLDGHTMAQIDLDTLYLAWVSLGQHITTAASNADEEQKIAKFVRAVLNYALNPAQ